MFQLINDLCKVLFTTSGCLLFVALTAGVCEFFPWEQLTQPVMYLSLTFFGALVLASVTKGSR